MPFVLTLIFTHYFTFVIQKLLKNHLYRLIKMIVIKCLFSIKIKFYSIEEFKSASQSGNYRSFKKFVLRLITPHIFEKYGLIYLRNERN